MPGDPTLPYSDKSGTFGDIREPLTEAQLREGGQRLASTALNVGALMSLADVEPERNPRNVGGEVLANLYREVGRLKNRVSYLEQNS